MSQISFAQILEDIDQLSLDEQESLLEILQHRLPESRRKQLAQEIQQARFEFAQGLCQPTTPDDLIKQALS
ncbi:MAG: hypothetical protein HC877_21325 [Thioploca sp.]|nr:hypothetical protein [Thioploca sp.]